MTGAEEKQVLARIIKKSYELLRKKDEKGWTKEKTIQQMANWIIHVVEEADGEEQDYED